MFQGKDKGGKDSRGGNGVSDERIDQLFREIDRSQLTEWEQKFMQSTGEYWKKNRRLSDKQRNRLDEIGRKQNEPKRA